ncbi:MAG: pyridoxamine 5'-phosphate oxidase family protein [Thermodesulfobacteriota bacterium]
MNYKEYFEKTKGTGVLSTADNHGRVDAAIYSRPHILEDGTLAFIMRDRLTHSNLQTNPFAVYLFIEEGPGFKGKRLFLCKVREERDNDRILSLSRRTYADDDNHKRFLMIFKVDKELPLVGAGEVDE